VVSGDDEDDAGLIVNFVEESPFPDAISPRRGLPILEALNVRGEIGVLAKNRVDVVSELRFHTLLGGCPETREVLRKLPGLEDSIGRR
jgi:hypothetical protein